jgi:DNA-binding MarR family transcriptional regulator
MNSLGFLIAVLGNDMAAALDARLKELDLKITMWPTLLMLWNEDGLTQTELSERCKTANYTTTRMLDTLENKGLIERKAHPTSRRAHLVYLTEEGKELKPKGLERAMAINEDYLSVFTKTESEAFLQLLNKLVEGKTPTFGT